MKRDASMKKLVSVYCLLAGGCDAVTGILLMSTPELTLRLMGVAEMPSELIYMRYIGVFVASIGLAYLYPFLLAQSETRFAVVLEVTALVRFSVAAFLAVVLLRGALTSPWWTVFATDLTLATVQIVILRRCFP
jgi:hypothetical protein